MSEADTVAAKLRQTVLATLDELEDQLGRTDPSGAQRAGLQHGDNTPAGDKVQRRDREEAGRRAAEPTRRTAEDRGNRRSKMVRKGSPVRVRQRALENPLETAGFFVVAAT
jgi:hypothetical protein